MVSSAVDKDILAQLQTLAILQAETNVLLKAHLKDYEETKKTVETNIKTTANHSIYFKACFWVAGAISTLLASKHITL